MIRCRRHRCTRWRIGCVVCPSFRSGTAAASRAQITSKLNHLGGTLDPHCAFLLQRSIKTLGVRVRQQNANALALATFLEQQPQVRAFGDGIHWALRSESALALRQQPQVRISLGRLRQG